MAINGEAARPDRLPARRAAPSAARSPTSRSRRSCASRGCPNAGKLRGYARPVFPGASVALQRFDGSRWRAVARATVDAAAAASRRREPLSGRVPGATRARPGLRPRREPDAEGGPGMRRLALRTFLLALVVPAPASAARFAIGVEKRSGQPRRGASGSRRAPACQVSRIGPFALSVRAPDARAVLSSVPGVAWVERIRASRRLIVHAERSVRRSGSGTSTGSMPSTRGRRPPNLTPRARRRPRLRHRLGPSRSCRTRSPTARASSPAPGRATRTATARSSPARSRPR